MINILYFWAWGSRVEPKWTKTLYQLSHFWACGSRMEPK